MTRAPGRPPLDHADPSVAVCVKLPSKVYDDTVARARQERLTVQELIRQDMRAAARRDND
jgi:hypothetical protein